MTDLPFVSALVQADLPVWEQCLQTEFLQKMENGTLSEDCFKSYLVEDSLYLREYAKIFAWGMTKATTMAAMRTYYSLLSFVQENEDLTRLQYLEEYGLREADIQDLPLRPESRAYLDCMIDAARTGEGEAEFEELCTWLRENKLERVGAFVFSPEDGTPAAKMEHADEEVAQRRAEIIAELQSRIMDAYNAARVGTVMEVLCEGEEPETGRCFGRTYADSPDIDGRVLFSAARSVVPGEFVMVRITGAEDGDLVGEMEENA